MFNLKEPSSYPLGVATFIILTAILLIIPVLKCQAQTLDCGQTLVVETDTMASQQIIRSQKNIIISEDGGKTGFALLALLFDSTFALSIKTVGGGACVNPGDSVFLTFTDGSDLKLNNMGKFNYEAKSTLYFNDELNNLDVLETLSEKRLSKFTVWTKEKSLTRNVSDQTAANIDVVLDCFNNSRGTSTFAKLWSADKIFAVVDEQPEYNGGYQAMMDFLKKNIRYQARARTGGAQGTVYVQFIVQRDGSITDVGTIRGAHPDLNAEAERVVKLMPPWIAGRQNGKPVNVRFVLPIKFKVG